MSNHREQLFKDKPLSEIADAMGNSQANSQNDQTAKAEFPLRQTDAIEQTAKQTALYTKYMFWSVVLLAIQRLVVSYWKSSDLQWAGDV